MKQGTILGSQIGRWIVLAALVVALGALLLTIQPLGAQDAAPRINISRTVFDHPENDIDPIDGATFRATLTDSYEKKAFWTLGGPDAEDFAIAGGVLRFDPEKFPNGPNFEVPTDRANDEDGSGGNLNPTDEGAGNNVYKVTVRLSGGGEDGDPSDDDYAGDDLDKVDLTINVRNANENGRVVISPLQPQVGTELTAILSDEDNVKPGTGLWQWARLESMTRPSEDDSSWEDIPERSNDLTYRPTADDEGKWLRVTVVYVDRAGADPRTVKTVSAYEVREDIVTSNQPPKFPDQSTLIGVDSPTETLPTQGRTATDRFIPETAASGTEVGAPVTAFDDKSDVEVITYSLRDGTGEIAADNDGNPDTPSASDGDAASFNINEVNGQITVSDKAVLDADGTDGQGQGATNPYTVVVRAVDGDGDTEDITVTIHVLQDGEPPKIDTVYVTDRLPTGFTAGNRVPTEMSHYELDRNNAPATVIDTNLDTDTVLDGEAAIYTASDPDPGATISWSLEGDDAGFFTITEDPTDAEMATLALGEGLDWEARDDTNKDYVYEVTIVVKDGTVDMNGNEHRDDLPVTLKVLNSTDDNQPGTVKLSNRVPEVATELSAAFADGDAPVTEMKWQWYRSTDTPTGHVEDTDRVRCVEYDPHEAADPANAVRFFIADAPAGWEAIDGATSAKYTPGFDEDSGGTHSVTTEGDSTTDRVEQWTGGDITVVITTDAETGEVSRTWSEPRCLRAAVTYRDDVDRTHSGADDRSTTVDETLEGTFIGSEYPVKPIDEENDKPEFQDVDGNAESVYRAVVAENNAAAVVIVDAAGETNLAATDEATDEDDTANDILTYTLSGQDAGSFAITGTIDSYPPGSTATSPDNDGVLTINAGLNYEAQDEYRVTITATDASGDSHSVNVIVNVTDVNEPPAWTAGVTERLYVENGTDFVSTYEAMDPEESGITYSLVDAAEGTITAAEIADVALFKINDIYGHLEFKESPNYEDPQDVGGTGPPDAVPGNNVYHVVVRADVADDSGDFITQAVTITVINKKEPPVFSETTDSLQISENPYDPEKEPPSAEKELYLLNRGVGKPTADLPEEPNLDVGIPVVAVDDDNTFTATDYTGSAIGRDNTAAYSLTNRPVQLIDGLTYTLSGTAAEVEPFDIVPATGQILTTKKLNYEDKNEYNVTVTATDPWGLTGSIDLTIELTDVDEVTVFRSLQIAGANSHTQAENLTDDLGDYTVTAYGGEVANPQWRLEGADASHFILTSSGDTRTLKFLSAPDYENPTGGAADDSNTYEVTIKVTDPSDTEVSDTFPVKVNVTDVDELGVLDGDGTTPYAESRTNAVGTYTLSGGTMDDTATWTLTGDDMGHFMLGGTGMSRDLTFSSAPDYENPMGGAADDSNTYTVTVMVAAGGETDTEDVTVIVTNVNELGALTGMESPSVNEGATDVGTYTLAGGTMDATATWSVDGTDMGDFELSGTGLSRMLKFSSAPDYEAPMGGADDDSNTYMVTVMAEAGGEMEMVEVEVMVDDVNELGDLGGSDTASVMEGATDVGTYTLTGGSMDATATWSVEGTDMGDVMLEGTGMSRMLKFSSAPDYETPMGGADNDSNTYMVTVMASAGGEEEMVAVTITVENAEEAGTVTLDPTRPSVGTPIVASVTDLDNVDQSTVMWQWAKGDNADGTGFTNIDGATMMTYTPDADDAGMYLQATATYTDGFDSGNTEMAVSDSAVTRLAVNGPDAVDHPENTRSVNATYTASGASGTVAWTVSGADAGAFTISGGMLTFNTTPNFEARGSADGDNDYNVTVVATADGIEADHDVVVTVTDRNEPGSVTGLPTSADVGDTLTATLRDEDMGAAATNWQWQSSDAMDGTFSNIVGATTEHNYTVAESDAGMYLRVIATYDDVHRNGQMVTSNTVMVMGDVVRDYDTNGTPGIQITELFDAIDDYFENGISISELFEVIDAYFM